MVHLVTGGSGFLGNLIALSLLESGEKVRVLDTWRDYTQPADIEYIEADVRDSEAVAKAMKGVDVVHHNAALVPLTKSGNKFREVNVDGSRIVAKEAVNAGVSYFIHMSSSALFGNSQCPITDKTPYSPVEIYGRAKMDGEMAVIDVCKQSNLPLLVIRPRTMLGLRRLGIFQILFDWISTNYNIYVIGNGNQPYQFLHAQDFMDAYMLAMQKGKTGVFNAGAKDFGTLREALENLIVYAGSTSKVKSLPAKLSIACLQLLDKVSLSPLAPWHYLTYHKPFYFDVSPLLELGWKPKYSNDLMFRESYDWFINNPEEAKKMTEGHASPHRSTIKQGILNLVKMLSK
ncbi:MAG: NAD-dependent epimerase/dehydratase family protein [Deferribacteraceae bacterium]|nr:NAD-dependent epimerase/dehydratase family protein [Deferribacteraceae bacterium]